MNLYNKSESYWREKIVAFLHDPPDKALYLGSHKVRSNQFLETFRKVFSDPEFKIKEEDSDGVKFIGQADSDAAALDRAVVPRVDVFFKDEPEIVHPTLGLRLKFPFLRISEKPQKFTDKLTEKSKQVLEKRLIEIDRAFSQRYEKYFFSFLYLVFFFFKDLKRNFVNSDDERVRLLSKFLEVLPADSRLPDHSILHHMTASSMIYSAKEYDFVFFEDLRNFQKSEKRPKKEKKKFRTKLAKIEVIPVKEFIFSSRKLSDYAVGSFFLSEITSKIISILSAIFGPDHIIWPNVRRNFFIINEVLSLFREKNQKLAQDFENLLLDQTTTSVSNTILAVVSFKEDRRQYETFKKQPEAFTKLLQRELKAVLLEEFSHLLEKFKIKIKTNSDFENFFRLQTNFIWILDFNHLEKIKNSFSFLRADYEYYRALDSLIEEFEKEFLFDDLERNKNDEEKKKVFNDLSQGRKRYRELQYQAAYKLLTHLEKTKKFSLEARLIEAPSYSGKKKKCHLFPEYESVVGGRSLKNPSLVKENERLSEIALFKRLKAKEERKRFRSTSEIAVSAFVKKKTEFLKAEKINIEKVSEKISKVCLEKEEEKASEAEKEFSQIEKEIFEAFDSKSLDKYKYYAICFLDIDDLGKKLSRGFEKKLISSAHSKILEKEVLFKLIRQKIKDLEKAKKCTEIVQTKLRNLFETYDRGFTPAIHNQISEMISNYASKTARYFVDKHGAELIFSGGDDVHFLSDLYSVFDLVKDLIESFYWPVVAVKRDGSLFSFLKEKEKFDSTYIFEEKDFEDVEDFYFQLSDAVSISASIYIVHYREPLKSSLYRARSLLSETKSLKRPSIAIRLKRRSAEERSIFLPLEKDLREFKLFVSLLNDLKSYSTNFFSKTLELAKSGYLVNDVEKSKKVVEYVLSKSRKQADQPKEKEKKISEKIVEIARSDLRRKADSDGLIFEFLKILQFLLSDEK